MAKKLKQTYPIKDDGVNGEEEARWRRQKLKIEEARWRLSAKIEEDGKNWGRLKIECAGAARKKEEENGMKTARRKNWFRVFHFVLLYLKKNKKNKPDTGYPVFQNSRSVSDPNIVTTLMLLILN